LIINTTTIDSDGNVWLFSETQDSTMLQSYDTDISLLVVDSLGEFKPIGISEDKIDPINFAVYPNPVKEKLLFRQFNISEQYQFQLYDNFGRLRKNVIIKSQQDEIQFSNLEPGFYVYKLVDSKNRTANGKIIKW
jgi:hypothetical protein